jgi:transposase-like protein
MPIVVEDSRVIKCPHCQGEGIVKYGQYGGVQRYWCKVCKRKFADNKAMPRRRIPPDRVGAAVSMFYQGLSLSEIQRSFEHMYDFKPSTATIYEWVVDYTNLALHDIKPLKARTGDTWVADEMVVKIGGKKYWNWNVMDADTRYLLACRLSPSRTTKDAALVMKKAMENAYKPPKRIVTDRLSSYIDGIELVFGSQSKHVQSGGIRAEVNNNLSERLQGTIRQREKVMRGLKSQRTAQLVMDGWTMHYNHFRPHESLGDRTPADAAGLGRESFKNWEDVAKRDVSPFSKDRTFKEERMRTRRLRDRTFRSRRL